MTTTDIMLDQVLELAHKLPPQQRGELIARLALELAAAQPAALVAPTANDAWEQLNQFREELYALGPMSSTLAEQLDATGASARR